MKRSEEIREQIESLEAELQKFLEYENNEILKTSLTISQIDQLSEMMVKEYSIGNISPTELNHKMSHTDLINYIKLNYSKVIDHEIISLTELDHENKKFKRDEWIQFDMDYYINNKNNIDVKFRDYKSEIIRIIVDHKANSDQPIQVTDSKREVTNHCKNGSFWLNEKEHSIYDLLMKINSVL